MRVFYLDTSLRDDVGHHGIFCRRIVGALRARGVETLVFGHSEVLEELKSELGIVPHFRFTAYNRFDADPIVGWLNDFLRIATWTREDLQRLPAMSAADLVLATSVRPAQLMALVDWRNALPPQARPSIVAESVATGLIMQLREDGKDAIAPNPQHDPRATLYRFIASRLPREENARFHFVAFAKIPSELFESLLQFPVRTLPLPFCSDRAPRNRAGAKPAVIACLGHQRVEKGYDLLPEIVETVLQQRADCRFLLQVVDPRGEPETISALREIAKRSDRVVLEEKAAGKERWPELMNTADLILCPYRRDYYASGYSAMAIEAIAHGAPLVFPAGSSIEKLVGECGAGGTGFDLHEPHAIATATTDVLGRFDALAQLSYAAALRWPETQGAARMVDRLLELVAP